MLTLKEYIKKEQSETFWNFILKHEDKDWYWPIISENPNITMDIIEKNPEKPWDWERISRNPNLTMDMIEKYPNKPWDWEYISKNPNLTMDMIERYPEKPRNWIWISKHPNLTKDIIEKYPNKPWDRQIISSSKFSFQNKIIAKECLKKYFSVKIIKKNYIRTFWNPESYLGSKRLFRSLEQEDYSVW